MKPLYTIGHSNHAIERFLSLLKAEGIEILADVRSRPYSGRHPQFNREELEEALKQAGMHYLFLGEELGGRPPDPNAYREDGRVDYRRWRKSHAFQQGNCAALKELGLAPRHIRGDGRVETHEDVEERLLLAVDFRDVGKHSLFGQEAERSAALQDAYDIQAVRCAFRFAGLKPSGGLKSTLQERLILSAFSASQR